jgi:hypothetical protein
VVQWEAPLYYCLVEQGFALEVGVQVKLASLHVYFLRGSDYTLVSYS